MMICAEGGGYNWMAPTLQSVDPSASFSTGTFQTPSSDKSNLLFKRPSRRPARPLGPNFGKERLKPDGTSSVEGALKKN